MTAKEKADKEMEIITWMSKKGYDRKASKDIAPIIVNFLEEYASQSKSEISDLKKQLADMTANRIFDYEKSEVEIYNLKKQLDASQSKWVSCAERLPDIDVDDEWNKNNKISKDVLTYSKEWGIRFGRYFYHANFWTINGVTSSNGVEVEFWQIINKPVEK